MKTAREMRDATLAYQRAAGEQTRRLLTSWIEHQVADAIDAAVTNRKFSVSMRIPSTMTGQNDYIKSYLEDWGYQVEIIQENTKLPQETVWISWLNA